jgi:hypothetical protein
MTTSSIPARCAEMRRFKLVKLGKFLPTTFARLRGLTRQPAESSWYRFYQLPPLRPAGLRSIAQIQVGKELAVTNFTNLILSIQFNLLTPISSCGGEPTPYGGGGGRLRLRLAPPPPSTVGWLPRMRPSSGEIQSMSRSPTCVTKTIDFGTAPAVGTVLMREGQRYELVALQKHVRQDGRATAVLIWRSHCAECAATFEIKTALKTSGAINRRCPLHHMPGRAVTASGRKRQRNFMSRHQRTRRNG